MVVRRWNEPDEGIWEPRSGRQHRTHSKVMSWVALDRIAPLCERRHVQADALRFSPVRDALRDAIAAHGFDDQLGSYVSVFDGDAVDASLLLLSLTGVCRSAVSADARHRCRGSANGSASTACCTETRETMICGEAAFGICSF